jgi:hypothetical protein
MNQQKLINFNLIGDFCLDYEKYLTDIKFNLLGKFIEEIKI